MKSRHLWLVAPVVIVFLATEAWAIPAFARKYKTACQTCHVMIPKLNSFGEAVRLNGYQIPGAEDALVKDEPLELGSEPWKQMWPRSLWPSSLPGQPPIALRIINDVQFAKKEETKGTNKFNTNFEFPYEVELLAGGRMGEKVGMFAEVEWHGGADTELETKQVYFMVNGLLSWADVPDEYLNLRVGLFEQHFLFAYNNTTRVGKNHPLWGNKKPSDVTIGGLKSDNGFRLQTNQPGFELNGIVADRVLWGGGLVTGAGESRFDNNNHKDLYYKLKLKLFGRDFLGAVGDEEVSTETKPSGGWRDNSVLLEHFGYFGQGKAKGEQDDDFDYIGGAIRGTFHDLDASFGFVHGQHDRPFGTDSTADLESDTWFAKAEYMIFPWLMARFVYEDIQFEAGAPLNAKNSSQDQERMLIGPNFAPLANMRIAIEWEHYIEHEKVPNPDNLWIRMDWAF